MPDLDTQGMNTSGLCCEGMQMAIGSHAFHIQLVGELILLPITVREEEYYMTINFCPWCKTVVNPGGIDA
jgi:hypothetical protein